MTGLSGTVTNWNDARGFGFIRPAVSGKDIYFHISSYRGGGRPSDGLTVYYELVVTGTKQRASRVSDQPLPARAAPHRPTPTTKAEPQPAPASAPRTPRPSPPPAAPAQGTPPRQAPGADFGRPPGGQPSGQFSGQAQEMLGKVGQQPAHVLAAGGFGVALVLLWLTGHIPVWFLGYYAVMSGIAYAVFAADKDAAQQGRWRTPEKQLYLWSVLGGWPGGLMAIYTLHHKRSKPSFMLTFWLMVGLNVVALLALMR